MPKLVSSLIATCTLETFRMRKSALNLTSPLLHSMSVSLNQQLRTSPRDAGLSNWTSAEKRLWFALSNGQATNSSTSSAQIGSVLSTWVMDLRIWRSTSSVSEIQPKQQASYESFHPFLTRDHETFLLTLKQPGSVSLDHFTTKNHK